jgi:hypothetical protein
LEGDFLNSKAAAAGAGALVQTREGRIVSWVLLAFLAWMPLQTPVAVIAWQYLHVSGSVAQAILLIKDFWAIALILILFVRHFREIRFRWFDWAALGYAGMIFVYSVMPAVLGSHLPALAVVASARELLVPVELYALGRLAGYAGVSPLRLIIGFLAVAAATAVFSIVTWAIMPQEFWTSTYNLVKFTHDVQGIQSSVDIWYASILSYYGSFGAALRAVGPFTHPVGTGAYFAMPLALAACAFWMSDVKRKVALVVSLAALVLFVGAVVTPISRGTWIGFVAASVVAGIVLHKYRLAGLTVIVFVLFVAFVPPFSWAIRSAANASDSSSIGHVDAITYGVAVVTAHPAGLGVGQGDQYGAVFSGGNAVAGVGENMYLTTYTSVGPIGALAFVVWMGAVLLELFRRKRASLPAWVAVGVGAGLLAEAIAGLSASTLMRFTTAASIWFLVGLVIAVPAAGAFFGWADLRHPVAWLRSHGTGPDEEPSES